MTFNDLIFKGDKGVWGVILTLTVFSMIAVFTSSTYLINKGGGSYYAPILAHLTFQIMALGIIAILQHINYQRTILAGGLLAVGSILTLLMIAFGLGVSSNGEERWITILGFQLQPSEFSKVAVVIMSAFILSKGQNKEGVSNAYLYTLGVLILLIVGLIFRNNLSTVIIILGTVVTLMFVARVKLKIIAPLVAIPLFFFGLLVIGTKLPEGVQKVLPERFSTWSARVDRFLNPEDIRSDTFKIHDKNRQDCYSKMAIAAGGAIGVGIGNNRSRDFLAESYSDYIMAIIFEEMGFWGPAIIMLAYLALLFRVYAISKKCTKTYPGFLVLACGIIIVMQACVHCCVTVGIIPSTGQSLPFVSRGGSSLISTALLFGIILSVSATGTKETEKAAEAEMKQLEEQQPDNREIVE